MASRDGLLERVATFNRALPDILRLDDAVFALFDLILLAQDKVSALGQRCAAEGLLPLALRLRPLNLFDIGDALARLVRDRYTALLRRLCRALLNPVAFIVVLL